MGTMAIGWMIVLSALFVQALSAPSGCIESCNFLQTSIHQTSSGYQDHANLVQARTNLNDYDYARPGNWTEHNQYRTDGGHGKVHEERGQYVDTSKKVRYYKKNFTTSYGNVNGVDAADLGESSSQHRYNPTQVPISRHFQSAYGLGETGASETGYNRVHSQQTQSSSTRIESKNERLEDFGEYGGYSQVNQHIPGINTQTIDTQHHVETAPNNWSRSDSYRTDGGHGQVFEEEGQYVTGPKKVRYYKKNYTSNYSSGAPQSVIGSATLDELHGELQRNLQQDLESVRRNLHQISSTGHTAATTHVGSTQMDLTQETVGLHDLQTAESGYRHLGYQGGPSTGSVHHTEQQREIHTDTRQLPYTYPTATADTYGTESHRSYQSHETHSSRVHPVPHSSHLSPGYVQVPGSGYQTSGYQTSGYHNAQSSGHHLDETHRTEALGTHRSNVLQNQLLTDSQRVYNPHLSHVTYPSRHGETRHYEEQWRSSSHTGESVAPERTITGYSGHGVGHTERAHYDRDAYNEHHGRSHTAQGYESHARTGGSSYDSAYKTGQLVTGSLDSGHAAHGADCTEETHQQYQHETRYHRKYKRDDRHVQQHQVTDEDFTQQDQELGQEIQQPEDLTEQSEQFTQQIQGSDKLAQQIGKLEFGQQSIDNHHLDDLTQPSEQFDFMQQSEHKFTQQPQGSDDFTQQTSELEFGQQTIDNHHMDDLTQQGEQFTQQTEGQFQFGQQTIDNPYLEDLTQQTQESDDFTQQASSKLEFGQKTDDARQLEQFPQRTARSESLTQQTQLDKHEFGQHVVDNKHLDDLTQQSEQFLQQTEGQLEFGQQIVGDQHLEDSTRQNEQFSQQTVESDDFTQRSVGKLEFGQQMQSTDKSAKPQSQRLEEFNEQNEEFTHQTGRFDDFTQQTMGHVEFGQLQQPHRSSKPRDSNYRLEDLTQQNEDLTQQTGGFDDFSQQTAGHLEYGQQREQQRNPSWPRHETQRLDQYSQQNGWDIDNLSQQSHRYPSYNDRNNKPSEWQLGQMSQRPNFDQDLTQQTNQDQLKPAPKPRPRPRYQKHDVITSHTDGTDTIVDDVSKPVEVNPEADIDNFHGRIVESGSRATYPGPNHHTSQTLYPTQGGSVFDNQKENMDRLHWVHKSNDATVGLQWHYTYHPSDLTSVEGSHNNYYPRHNLGSVSPQMEDTQQQSKPFDFNQRETQDEDTLEDKRQNSYISQSSQRDNYDQQLGSSQQTETPHFDNQFNRDSDQIPSKVIPLQNSQPTSEQEKRSTPTDEPTAGQTNDKPESRILQAYGGGGPYDVPHSNDFYNRVKPNPSVTLPPLGGDDPWDIREKPRESLIPRNEWSTVRYTPQIVTTTEAVETTTQTAEATTTEPSFWRRVGHKITNTYDKAKEKAKDFFG
ncbi:PREDICTED: filaggrin-2-like [Vollenhovia emeryi]|uniref:filaggrin-2-like n=1 Tax=Vollenhovia emeryi TaxID=411798 RepID=UPI0005F4CFC8|nr:PREDICTED: filaggrin-2-like [Vollenhovia emeryi]